MTDEKRGRRATAFAVAVLVMVIVAGLLVALLLLLFQELDCFDGDGGSPYVADDSPRAALCRPGSGVVGLLIPLAWLVGLVLSIIGVLRWVRRRSGALVLVLALVAPLALPGLTFLGLTRPSGSCTGDKLDAYWAWRDGGAAGQPPFDCDRY